MGYPVAYSMAYPMVPLCIPWIGFHGENRMIHTMVRPMVRPTMVYTMKYFISAL